MMTEEGIFAEALATSPAERGAYLDRACGQDSAMRAAVEALLRANVGASGFLESPPAGLAATEDSHVRERPGTVIGPYKLLQVIGEGGMGVVFLAEQDKPLRRKVALKVIKPGLDSNQVIARFEAERQALALMDHVNIARVFDGGTTTSGRPYFVMELVRGVPITKYCDDNHLTPRERLELFIPACQAIQHAHQKGVIHRDIKPSNVLVTLYDGKPVPKVIDFGVAKATEQKLTERTLFTNFGTMVGTLEYMSPEQAEMSALGVDTRSDIYSLGVLLYQLLTGSTPLSRQRLKKAGFAEVLRIIKEEEPQKPSTRLTDSGEALTSISAMRRTEPARLTKLVRGELDWIVMRTLEKDRDRRYETADGLAADVQRYLADEPVLACPPSASYRLRKFVRRHKPQVLAASLLLIATLAAAVFVLWHNKELDEKNRDLLASNAAEKKAKDAAERREAELKLENVMTKLRDSRTCPHSDNWRDEAWATVAEAAASEVARDAREKVARLRDEAAACLAGLSARCSTDLRIGTSALAWDSSGRYVLMAGCAARGKIPPQPARLWDNQLQQIVHTSRCRGEGPVAFTETGVPLQLVRHEKEPYRVLLWDVAKDQLVHEFRIENSAEGDSLSMALSPDGSFAAAATGPSDKARKSAMLVWDARRGKLLQHMFESARILAFSPDNTLVASGDHHGRLTVRSVESGEVVTVLEGERNVILALAFHRDRHVTSPPATAGWLVAAGDDAGTVTIWDITKRLPRSAYRSPQYQVQGVAFSPDGMIVASASRGGVDLWDSASGRKLLFLRGTNWMMGVAFSPDGKRIVMGGSAAFGHPDRVKVWDLEPGRGIQTFSGLHSSIDKVAFSPDEQFLAALSHDGRIGIWDLRLGWLVRVLEAPKPAWIDNTAIAFGPDGKTLVYSGSSNSAGDVRLWDLETGRVLKSWVLPPGLNNLLAFRADQKLLHFQIELRAGQRLPDSDLSPADHPLVGRMRDLNSADYRTPMFELDEFDRQMDYPRMPSDGRYLTLVGYKGTEKPQSRQIRTFDALTGRTLWSSEIENAPFSEERLQLIVDQTGRFLAVIGLGSGAGVVVDLPTGRHLGRADSNMARSWCPEMPYWVGVDVLRHQRGLPLLRRGEHTPVLEVGIDASPAGTQMQFNPSGTRFAWGNEDGTVSVLDIPEVQRRLAAVGLSW